jgi:ribosomal protein S27AE
MSEIVRLFEGEIKVEVIANASNVSNGSAYSILHDRLHFRKVCSRCVPKNLSAQHKAQRLENSRKHFARYALREIDF